VNIEHYYFFYLDGVEGLIMVKELNVIISDIDIKRIITIGSIENVDAQDIVSIRGLRSVN